MSNTPIYDCLVKYAAEKGVRLHMPGHGAKAPTELYADAYRLDITELDKTCDLVHGDGAAARSLDMADALYGGSCAYSTCGASPLVKAAIYLAAGEGGRILADRRLHLSALDGMIALGQAPDFFLPDDDLEQKIKTSGAKAVFLTSPTYYGEIADVLSVSALCKKYGKTLVVDNSHGSHLFCTGLHPFKAGADFCVDSLHKTLPAMTGCALLIGRRPRAELLEAVRFFSSTSPNYFLAGSIEFALEYLKEGCGRDIARIAAKLEAVKSYCGSPERAPFARDPLRLCIDCRGRSEQFKAALRKKRVEIEFEDGRYAVMLFSPLTEDCELDRALAAVDSFMRETRFAPAGREQPPAPPHASIPPREAYFAETEEIPLGDAIGRIAAKPLYLYPPGVPIVIPGERINSEIVRLYSSRFDKVAVVK